MRSVAFALTLAALAAIAAAAAACEPVASGLPPAGPNALEFTIKTDPPGATVVVDGAALGPGPQTVKLNPGPHRVRANMNGYYPAPEARIQVGSSEPREITLSLVASH